MFKWLMFISSYLPLYVLVIIINFPQITTLRFITSPVSTYLFLLIILFFMLISIVVLFYILFKKTNRTTPVGYYKKLDDNLISYIMTYLIPLLSIDIYNIYSITVNIILFLMIGLIYTKNDLVYLNPLFSLVGFYVYKTDADIYIITKMKITQLDNMREKGIEVGSLRLANDVHLYKKKPNNN